MREVDKSKLALAREFYITSIEQVSLEDVATKFDLSKRTVERRSSLENWPSLRRAFWMQMAERTAREKREKSRQVAEMAQEERVETLRRAIRLVSEMVEVDPEVIESLSPSERARLSIQAAKTLPALYQALALAQGEPTERTEMRSDFYLSRSEVELLSVPSFLDWLRTQVPQGEEPEPKEDLPEPESEALPEGGLGFLLQNLTSPSRDRDSPGHHANQFALSQRRT